MTDKEYIDEALDFIVEREQEQDYICDILNYFPEETDICAEVCQGLDKFCVYRFLERRNEQNDK